MLQQTSNPASGRAVTLSAGNGFTAEIVPCGAALKALNVPTGDGSRNVVLGYANDDDYWRDTFYMGATVGRYANRIANGRARIGTRNLSLDVNETEYGNCLHGGHDGFHRQDWQLAKEDGASLTARYRSPAGAGGFPGNVDVLVTFALLEPATLVIDYVATSDEDTILSLTNHAYFNLDPGAGTIDQHTLKLFAEHFTPVDERMIPTGEVRAVGGSDYDYSTARFLADALTGARHRLDTNFVVPSGRDALTLIALLEAPDSDLQMLVSTSQPGFQVYTGDYLESPFRARQGICIETQNFPDAPNQPGFPSAKLAAGDTYRQRTQYEFRVPASVS